MLSYISTWDILETSRWNNAQYALSHQKVCYFMCGPIWASPYLLWIKKSVLPGEICAKSTGVLIRVR